MTPSALLEGRWWARAAAGAALGGAVLCAAGPAAGGAPGASPEEALRRHAGVVVSVDAAAGRLVVEEMAPGNDIRRIAVQVEPTTSLVEITRTPEEVVVSRGPRTVEIASTYRYVEQPLHLESLGPGDFVVVVLRQPLGSGQPVSASRIELTARARGRGRAASSPPGR